MAKRNKILVPQARKGLDQLQARITNTDSPSNTKYEIASEEGIELQKGYNGEIKAKDAGKIGGKIGGQMVRELINRAKNELNK